MTTSEKAGAVADRLRPVKLAPLPPRPLVSVLMSNYNYGAYVGRAIETVIHQTYPNWELIICDDGSSDNSVATIEPYLTDRRIRLLKKENGGQATGFNACFRESAGQIICFLDADDMYLPKKLGYIVEKFEAHPDCGCVLNRSFRVDRKLNVRGALPLLARLPEGWCGHEALGTGGILPNMPGTPGMNIRREVAERCFPLPTAPPLHRVPDMMMWRLIPLFARIAGSSEPLAKICLHDGNSYQSHRVTAESIARELRLCEALWQAQRQHLQNMHPALANRLAPLDSSPSILVGKYIHARLSRAPDHRAYRQKVLAATAGRKGLRRLFWWGTGFLPVTLFQPLMNICLTQNRFKQAVLFLLKIRIKNRQGKRELCTFDRSSA